MSKIVIVDVEELKDFDYLHPLNVFDVLAEDHPKLVINKSPDNPDSLTITVQLSKSEYKVNVLWFQQSGILVLIYAQTVNINNSQLNSLREMLDAMNLESMLGHFSYHPESGELVWKTQQLLVGTPGITEFQANEILGHCNCAVTETIPNMLQVLRQSMVLNKNSPTVGRA